MRAFSRVVLAILLMNVLSATLLSIRPVQADPPKLYDRLTNDLGFTHIAESTQERFAPAGTYNVTLYGEWADFHYLNNLTWYAVGTNEYNQISNLIFSGPEGNAGLVNPPISKMFLASGEFGLAFGSPDHCAMYFTETSRNPDGLKHAMVYENLDDPNMYFIGFENLYGVEADRDFDDMVVSLEIVSQPVSITGVNWYIMNSTSNKAMIYLDGGYAESTYDGTCYVEARGWDEDRSIAELAFMNEMVLSGFSVLTNKDRYTYFGYETIVKDVAEWLLSDGYGHVFLLGHSAGGSVVAYEVQKEYASTLYSAAVFSSAPVACWGQIFQSAYRLQMTKWPHALSKGRVICGVPT